MRRGACFVRWEARRAFVLRLGKGAADLALSTERGKTVSGSQKALKIISIILVVWSILVIALGAFLAAGSAVPGMSAETIDMGGEVTDMATAALAFGIGTAIGGVINLVIGLLGLRGAKNPHKIGLFFVLCIVGLVLGVVGIVMDFMQGSFQWTSLVSVVIVAVCTYLAHSIKKQA